LRDAGQGGGGWAGKVLCHGGKKEEGQEKADSIKEIVL